MKKAVLLVGAVLILGVVGYLMLQQQGVEDHYLKSFGDGTFEVYRVGASTGLCDDEKIISSSSRTTVATITLCEEHITNIEQIGDSIEVTISNPLTGDRKLVY